MFYQIVPILSHFAFNHCASLSGGKCEAVARTNKSSYTPSFFGDVCGGGSECGGGGSALTLLCLAFLKLLLPTVCDCCGLKDSKPSPDLPDRGKLRLLMAEVKLTPLWLLLSGGPALLIPDSHFWD